MKFLCSQVLQFKWPIQVGIVRLPLADETFCNPAPSLTSQQRNPNRWNQLKKVKGDGQFYDTFQKDISVFLILKAWISKIVIIFSIEDRYLTGSPLMYHDKFVAGLEVWAIHIRSAVSPTWYCFLGVSIVGPSSGRSVKKRRYKKSLLK